MSKIWDFVGCSNWMQALQWSSWDFLSPLVSQKINIDDYGAPFCERQYVHGYCYNSLFKFKSSDQSNSPQSPQILDIYSVVALWRQWSVILQNWGRLFMFREYNKSQVLWRHPISCLIIACLHEKVPYKS